MDEENERYAIGTELDVESTFPGIVIGYGSDDRPIVVVSGLSSWMVSESSRPFEWETRQEIVDAVKSAGDYLE